MPFKAHKAVQKKPSSYQSSRNAHSSASQRHRGAVIQRAQRNSQSLTRQEVLHLQRTIGNRAIGRLLRPASQNADAARSRPVAQRKQAEGTAGLPVQRMEKEEEPLMQRMEKEEEPLMQRMEDEEEQPMQRMEDEEEQPMQRMEDEEEQPMQGKFTASPTPVQRQGKGGGGVNATGMPGRLKAGLEGLSGKDLSGVRVHRNSSKPAQVNALAYTQGSDIHVAPGQEKHLPHEGWHAVQQMQGRVQPTIQAKGVSINDDKGLEREADVMGAKALALGRAGRAAGPGPQATASQGRRQGAGAIQRFTANPTGWTHPSGDGLRVADDGTLAVEVKGGAAGWKSAKRAWATDAKITAANAILKALKAGIKLFPMSTKLQGPPPGQLKAAKISLKEIEVKKSTGAALGGEALDCIGAAETAQGKYYGDWNTVTKNKAGRDVYGPATGITSATTPDKFNVDVYKSRLPASKTIGKSKTDILEEYFKLPAIDREKFDKEQGTNKFAVPNVGQGMAMIAETQYSKHDKKNTFNYHFVTAILKSAQDYITLEGLVGWAQWFFRMYGPFSKKQSFHEEYSAMGVGGSHASSYVIQQDFTRDGKTNAADVPLNAYPATDVYTISWAQGVDITDGKPTANFHVPHNTKVEILDATHLYEPSAASNDPHVEMYQVRVVDGPQTEEVGWVNYRAVSKAPLATNELAKLAASTNVKLLESGSTWISVKVEGGTHDKKTGWIKKQFYDVR